MHPPLLALLPTVFKTQIALAADSHAECTVTEHLNPDFLSVWTTDIFRLNALINMSNLFYVQLSR